MGQPERADVLGQERSDSNNARPGGRDDFARFFRGAERKTESGRGKATVGFRGYG
jgi:hypothetical protein